MKLDKNGYRSEKRDSFTTAVKFLTFIFGLGVAIAIVCVYALTQGCGSSGNNAPIYDENGQCTANCNGEGDVSVVPEDGIIYPLGDTCNNDTCSGKPPSMITGACEAIKAGKKMPEVCTPQEYKEANCGPISVDNCQNDQFFEWPSPGAGQCKTTVCSTAYHDICPSEDDECHVPKSSICITDAECQKVPCEAMPPEVCWGLPCMFVGKWNCHTSVHDYTNLEFYDNGDGYCRIENLNGYLYYKPGADHVQWPPSGPFENKYALLDGESQLETTTDNGTYTCTKLAEE